MGLIKDIRDIEQSFLKDQLKEFDIVILRKSDHPFMFIKRPGNYNFVDLSRVPAGSRVRDYVLLKDYNDDLKINSIPELDVIKIYRTKYKYLPDSIIAKLSYGSDLSDLPYSSNYELIWER